MSDKRAQIIKMAKKSFIERGFTETSMDEISRLAKVSKGGLYHHFSGKDDILMAIFVENQEQMGKNGPELFQKKEKIKNDLGKFYENLDMQHDLMTIWLQAVSETKNNSKFRELVLERRRYLEDLTLLQFKKLQKMGFLKNYNEKELSHIGKGSLALIKGCALDELTGDDKMTVKKAWVSTMHALFTSSKKKPK